MKIQLIILMRIMLRTGSINDYLDMLRMNGFLMIMFWLGLRVMCLIMYWLIFVNIRLGFWRIVLVFEHTAKTVKLL